MKLFSQLLSLGLTLLLSASGWASTCDQIPSPLGPQQRDLERITCELEIRDRCEKHFKHDFEKRLYMRDCVEPTFLEKYVINPITPKGTAYCAVMFATDIVELLGALGEAGKDALVAAYIWAENTPAEDITDLLNGVPAKANHVAQKTAQCLRSEECRARTVRSFIDAHRAGFDVARKTLQYLMGAARSEASRQVAYWDCLKPEAQDAHVCAVVAGIFIPATKISLILKAKGMTKLTETTEKVTAVVTRQSRAPHAQTAPTPHTPVPKPLPRSDFLKRWSSHAVTTPTENRAWIALSLAPKQAGVFFLDTQNTALKFLNDTLKDKTLVNAIGNRYNASVRELVEQFKRDYPGVEVSFYSDYKSLRAGIRGPPGKENELMQELGRRLAGNDQTFLKEMQEARYVSNEILATPWFRSGLARSSDEANLVTRFSRRSDDGVVQNFETGAVKAQIQSAWSEAERTRQRLEGQLRGTPLVEAVEGTRKFTPSADVLEVVRKTSDPNEVARILSARYNREVTPEQAKSLRQYFDQVDQFSPGLLIPERVAHRFENARAGGVTIDFAGVGSQNAHATARGLASGRSLEDAVVAVRQQERRVTAELDQLKGDTIHRVRQALAPHGIKAEITVSGDDMLVIPNAPLTLEAKRALVALQGKSDVPSSMRTSFFPPGMMNDVERAKQATIGEGIEKSLRKKLEGQLTPQELKNTLIAVDMRGTVTAKGAVALDVALPPRLTPAKRELIRTQFKQAVEEMNQSLRAQGTDATMAAVP